MSAVTVFAPSILFLTLHNAIDQPLESMTELVKLPVAIIYFLSLFSQATLLVIKYVEKEDLDSPSVLKYLNSKSWKSLINTFSLNSFKAQSEKEIINLRLLAEKNVYSDNDYEYIASLMKEKKDIEMIYNLWLNKMSAELSTIAIFDSQKRGSSESDNFLSGRQFLETNFKMQQINDSLKTIVNRLEGHKLNTILNEKNSVHDSLGQLNFLGYTKKEGFAPSTSVDFLHANNNKVLSHGEFVNLNEKNYKDLKSIIFSKNRPNHISSIENCFTDLKPYDWPKVDWVRIKSFLIEGYIDTDSQYTAWLDLINEKVKKQEALSGQRTLDFNLKKEIKYPLNTKSESTALPDINKNFEKIKESRKYCEYLNYNPQFNALVWLELKENYEALIQSSLAPHLFLELNSRLNTVLPLIMHSDQVLGKNILLDSSQKSAQDLIIQNLTMLTDNIKELRNHNDASLVQELQASANYQKMKMGKS